MYKKLLLGVFIFFTATSLRSQSTVAEERFSGAPGTLHLYNGGSGWFAPWSSQNTVTTDGYRILDTNPMVHPEFPNPGNYVQGGFVNTTTGRYFSDVAFSEFQDAEDRIGVGVLYFSFLVRKLQDNDFPIEIVLADATGQPWAVNEELISIGYFGVPSNAGGNRYWSVAAFNGTAIDLSDYTITIGETYQIIVEIDFEAATTINMWVNPTDGIPDLLAPDASVNSTENLGFFNMVLRFGEVGNDHGSFDEFIFSNSLDVVLPVTYVSFEGESVNGIVQLNWSTATEQANDYFLIQRSKDQSFWQKVGRIDGNGDSNELLSYSFEDKKPHPGVNYYRLIQVDYDGKQQISKVIRVQNSRLNPVVVHMAQKVNAIELNCTEKIRRVHVFNLSGGMQAQYTLDEFFFQADLSNLSQGLYQIVVETTDGYWRNKVIVD